MDDDLINTNNFRRAFFGGSADSPEEVSSEQSRIQNQITEELLATLSPREEKIIKMRFGFGTSGSRHTLAEIGQHFAVSPSTIRRIETKAIRKLRHPSRAALLKIYLEELDAEEEQPRQTPVKLIPVIEKVEKLTPELIAHLRSHEQDLDKLDWHVFEHLVAEFLVSWGFEDVRLVGRNSLTSADIYAAKIIIPLGVEHRIFIEVKRWKDKVGIEVIDKVLGAMIGERDKFGWHAGMIVTVAGYKKFSKWTPQELKMKGLELKDRNDLLRWLRDYKQNAQGLWLPNPPTLL